MQDFVAIDHGEDSMRARREDQAPAPRGRLRRPRGLADPAPATSASLARLGGVGGRGRAVRRASTASCRQHEQRAGEREPRTRAQLGGVVGALEQPHHGGDRRRAIPNSVLHTAAATGIAVVRSVTVASASTSAPAAARISSATARVRRWPTRRACPAAFSYHGSVSATIRQIAPSQREQLPGAQTAQAHAVLDPGLAARGAAACCAAAARSSSARRRRAPG